MSKTPSEAITDVQAICPDKPMWHVTHLDTLNEKGEYYVVFVAADTKEEAERNPLSAKMGGRILCRKYGNKYPFDDIP